MSYLENMLFLFHKKIFHFICMFLEGILSKKYTQNFWVQCYSRLSRESWELSFFDTAVSSLEWYEMRIFGPKLITIIWLESLSSTYKTGPNAVLKINVRIDLIRTLWMRCLLKLNWEFSWIHNTQSVENTVHQTKFLPWYLHYSVV